MNVLYMYYFPPKRRVWPWRQARVSAMVWYRMRKLNTASNTNSYILKVILYKVRVDAFDARGVGGKG